MITEGNARLRAGAVVAALLLGPVILAVPAKAAIVVPSGFVIEAVVTGLTEPVAISFATDGRMFIAEKRGVIRVFRNGALLPTPFVDISTDVNNYFEHGMLGMTLHPDFPTMPYVYVVYVYDPPGVTKDTPGARIARVERIEADPVHSDIAASGPSARVVLVGGSGDASTITNPNTTPALTCWRNGAPVEDCIPQDSYRHSAGNVRFGTDGALYIGNGDVDRLPGGPQDPSTWVGAILRVDPATGEGLPDNPFYDGNPRSNRSKTWVYGLRNPFRFSLDPVSSEMLIGDVGQDTWESMHRGQAGKNYGWPCYEGGSHVYPVYQNTALCQNLYTSGPRIPTYTYTHTGSGGSITAGDWYHGAAYPTAFQGAHFFADYSQGWVKYLEPDGFGGYVIRDFASDTNATGVTSSIVHLIAGADTNLYWVSIGKAAVYRLRYTGAGNIAPTAVARSDLTAGGPPLTVSFDGLGSFDPDGHALTYRWDFGDGSSSANASPTHTYESAGSFTVTLTVTDPASATSTDTMAITVGEPPALTITAPAEETVVQVGTQVPFSGTASDSIDGDLTSSISWSGALHHNVHTHPGYLPLTTGGGGSVLLEDHGDDTFLELCAQVTNSRSVAAKKCVTVRPRTTTVTIDASPQDRPVSFGGITRRTPYAVEANVGGTRTLSAPLTSGCFSFDHWSDGGAATHDTVVSEGNNNFTATFVTSSPCSLVLSLAFDEGSGGFAHDASGFGHDAQLWNGATWGSGRLGSAVRVDGLDDVAAVADAPSLGGLSALTAAAWVYRSAAQTGWSSVVTRQLTTTSEDQFYLSLLGNQPRFGLNTVDGGNQNVGGGNALPGEWTHVAGVYDGTTMTLYVNGQQWASMVKTGTTPSSGRPVLMGGNANGSNPLAATEILDGRIDDVRLYTRALSANEVSALASGSGPTAVALRSFSARRAGSFVELNWQTAQESMLLGFNLYRYGGGVRIKLNRTLIVAAGAGAAGGGQYRFLDRRVRGGRVYTYRLQAVKIDRTRSWLATTIVKR